MTKAWARVHPQTLAAFQAALEQGQEIADTPRPAVEHAMESVPAPFGLTSVLALDSYLAGPVDAVRIQRVADVMHQFVGTPAFNVRSMLAS